MKHLVCAALLAACGTDAHPIDLSIPGTQVLVTEKVNGGAWKKLSGDFDSVANATTYAIEIGDEYELAVVCVRSGPRDAGQFVAGEVFGTSDDPEVTLGSWKVPNCLVSEAGIPDTTGAAIKVSGTFDEAMKLSIGVRTPINVGPGQAFSFTVDSGLHDLVAYSNTKMLIQHDLHLDADTTLDPVHVASDGSSILTAVVPTIGDAEDGAPLVSDQLFTRNHTLFVFQNEDPAGALFVPVEMLEPGDEQKFYVEFFSQMQVRLVELSDPTRIGDATLLPRIEAVTPHSDELGATWTPLSEFYTTATLTTYAPSTNGSRQTVTASKSWLARHGEGELEFDLAVDGYDPSWTTAFPFTLTLTRWSPGLVVSTSMDLFQTP
ncbi:MAG: hypothetical protein ABI678_08820 [Kofleriaceae bacterium]